MDTIIGCEVGLPKLTPTDIISIEKRTDEIHKCPPGPNRETIRSKTFPGIAKAMAEQWNTDNSYTSTSIQVSKDKQTKLF